MSEFGCRGALIPLLLEVEGMTFWILVYWMVFDLLVVDTLITDLVSQAINSIISQTMKYHDNEWFRNLEVGELRGVC